MSVKRVSLPESSLLSPAQSDASDTANGHAPGLMGALDVAAYTTDAAGRIAFYNDAAAELWGRRPKLGEDQWCGSWRLYWPDGRPMLHDECPMAVTLREGRPCRGLEAVAERPDGTRVSFLPYPTPIHDASGALIGAVNVLVDITERKRVEQRLVEQELRRSKDELSDFVENAPVGLHWVGPDGTILWANRAELEMLGYSADEYVGHNNSEFYVDQALAKDVLDRLAQGDAVHGYEASLRCKDGSIRHVLIDSNVVRHNGTFVHTRCFTLDITERKRAEAALRDSEERLRLAMASGAMGTWEWNIESGEVRWSEGLEMIHGLQPGTFGGTFETFLKDIHPDDSDHVQRQIGSSIAQGSHEIEYRIVLPNGNIRWVSGKGRVIYDDSGKATRMIGVCMDVTERRNGEEHLRRASEAKDEFLGMISHELRTPITTIYGGVRLLRSRAQELDEGSRAAMLSDMEEETDRLRRIVEDLLVLSRMELGEQVPTEPVLLQHIVQRAASSCRKCGRTVDVDMEPDMPPVAADATYLEQTLRNLLSNADKYSPDDSPIEVRAGRRNDREAIISVVDHGPGLAEDEVERIFERFYRSEHTARTAGGAGIGLTVCQRLVEAQSGSIWARSVDGGGLEVSFTLPLYTEGMP